MNLETFLSSINIQDTGIETNTVSMRALQFMEERRCQAVKYTYSSSFVANNLAVMQVNSDGLHMFSISILSGLVDIAYEFTSNVQFDILLNEVPFKGDIPIVVCNGQYTEKKVRFYIDPNNVPEKINLTYKVIVLNCDLRRQLTSIPVLYAGSTVCSQGVISRR